MTDGYLDNLPDLGLGPGRTRKSRRQKAKATSEKPKGLVCPKCGGSEFHDAGDKAWDTINTVKIPRGIRRYRECRNCGRRIRTREVIEN